ncbi:MAG: thioredoxin domain-containing protein [Nocardioides sp.]|nr:thioredoxin domain-containing protein [Nocardioides sp.]
MSKKKSAASRSAASRAAAERAAAIRAEQTRRERRRQLLIGGAVLLVGALLVGLFVWWQSGTEDTGKPSTPPAGASQTYAVGYGAEDAPMTVEVYSDFLCPVCGAFEAEMNDELTAAADAGDLRLEIFPVAILDRSSETQFPRRAANAMAVVLDTTGAEEAKAFHDLLFAQQPTEGGAGEPTDDELVALAVEAGAEESAVRPGIEDLQFEQWVVDATADFSDKGFTGTPTVVVDGEQLGGETLAEVIATLRDRIGS